MSRTRPFSIFLLKQGYDATNSLKEEHSLNEVQNAANLPAGAQLYILDTPPVEPWWRDYFGVRASLRHSTKGALVFISVGDRNFALSFGHVFHNLKDNSYEYDFGLRVTLNSLDPRKLKSADIIDPGSARRKRTQVPAASDLTLLDFDSNAEIVRSLTGKVKEEFSELFKSATGSASLKVGLKVTPDRLVEICATLLDLYSREDFLENFPSIGKLSPERDPDIINNLNEQLLERVKARSDDLSLAIPDIIDYRDNICCRFQGKGGIAEVYTDVSLDAFYDYLGDDYNFEDLTIEKIKGFSIALCDPEGRVSKAYSIYNSLLLDIVDQDQVFHICEGGWYRADLDYVRTLKGYIDERCEPTNLIDYSHDKIIDGVSYYSEERYNEAIPQWQSRFLCLDQTDIAPDGFTQIEPCDLYCVEDGSTLGILYHLKISTRSSQLSHLFNQGVNSAELLILEQACRDKMKELLGDKIGNNNLRRYQNPIDDKNFKVVFGVITRKPAAEMSDNLPLFSKISLMRSLKSLELMQIPAALTYINDTSPPKEKYSTYAQVCVQITENNGGKKEVLVMANQSLPEGTKIGGCCAAIRDSAVGKKFKVYFSFNKNNNPYSNHSWAYEEIN